MKGKGIGVRERGIGDTVRRDPCLADVSGEFPVPNREELVYTRLFLERVRIPLIAKELSNALCSKSEKSEQREGPETTNLK